MNCKVLKGIMEMADTIVINKADGDNIRKAQLAKSEFNRAYIYFQQKSGWIPTTATCSAITQDGIPEVWETITKFIELTKSNDYFNENAWNRTNIGCSRLSTNN
jgi:LAO/AO transport system kinase